MVHALANMLTFSGIAADLRSGVRQLQRTPGFACTAVLTLAIGFGATTTILASLNAHLFDRPPARDSEALRQFVSPHDERPPTRFPVETYTFIRERSTRLSDLTCLGPPTPVRWHMPTRSGRGTAVLVSGNYFSAIGTPVLLGRPLRDADDHVDAAPVAVLSYRFWQRDFGGDRGVVGQSVTVNGKPVVIVGVMQDVPFIDRTSHDLTIPVAHRGLLRDGRGVADDAVCRIVARLSPGASSAQGDAEGVYLMRLALASTLPALDMARFDVQVRRFGRGVDDLTSQAVDGLSVIGVIVVVGAILLITCTNIGGMLLAKGMARRGEIATRLSLGASPARIVRQLLVESVLLGTLGGALGLWLGYLTGPVMRRIVGAFTLDSAVIVAVLAASATVGALFGLVPALQAGRTDVTGAARVGARGSLPKLAGIGALIAVQVALSFTLLVAAGLHLRSLYNLLEAVDGITRNALSFEVDPFTASRRPLSPRYAQEMSEQLTGVPGVRSVSIFQAAPAGVACVPGPSGDQQLAVNVRRVGPRYLEASGRRLTAGRDVTWEAGTQGSRVAVVGQSFAKRMFPNTNPIGRTFGLASAVPPGTNGECRSAEITIVGVAADLVNPRRPSTPPAVYVPLSGAGPMIVNLQTTVDDLAVVVAVRRAMTEFDSMAWIDTVESSNQQRSQNLEATRLLTAALGGLGVVALLLTSLGIYGTLAYAASRRASEVGLRIALGAQRRAVVMVIVRETVLPVVIGCVLGLFSVPALSIVFAPNLFGEFSNADRLSIAAIIGLLLTVAVIAASAPAWRASRREPMSALRAQ